MGIYIKKELTKSEAIFHHRKMWHWIAKMTRLLKRKVYTSEYFDFFDISLKNRPPNDSYCCGFNFQFCDFFKNPCPYCPIDWGNDDCEENGTLFSEWNNCDDSDWERVAELADKIAELPEKRERY